MSIFHIDVHHFTHRCPANPLPHVVQTNRTVVATYHGGPCLKPVKVQGIELPCGRVATPDKQCAACRTQVIINNTVVTELGFEGAAQLVIDEYLDEPIDEASK